MRKYFRAAAGLLLTIGGLASSEVSAQATNSFVAPLGTQLPPLGYNEGWRPISYLTNPLVYLPGPVQDHTNNYACKSSQHPNPVLVLHGGFANKDEDLNYLQNFLAAKGYCTFSLNYGALTLTLGGVNFDIGVVRRFEDFGQPTDANYVPGSGTQIAGFITSILAETGASKIDIVGHSSGAFMSLYVPKFAYATTVTNAEHGLIDYNHLTNQQVTIDYTQPLSKRIDHVVSIAPPTRGTFPGALDVLAKAVLPPQITLTQLEQALGTITHGTLGTLGGPLVGDPILATFSNGPIAQPGVDYTILVSKYDEIIWNLNTPPDLPYGLSIQGNGSFLPAAPNVSNKTIQDFCSIDLTGHIGEAYDLNVWTLVTNALDPAHAVRLVDPLNPLSWGGANTQLCVGPNVPF